MSKLRWAGGAILAAGCSVWLYSYDLPAVTTYGLHWNLWFWVALLPPAAGFWMVYSTFEIIGPDPERPEAKRIPVVHDPRTPWIAGGLAFWIVGLAMAATAWSGRLPSAYLWVGVGAVFAGIFPFFVARGLGHLT